MRFVGLLPAAGRSRRMGSPKLLLPIGGRPLIVHLLESMTAALDDVRILVRQDDRELLKTIVECPSIRIVTTDQNPPDMRASVQILLRDVAQSGTMAVGDAWVLTPADRPGVCTDVFQMLLAAARHRPDAIHVPTYKGRGGHPAVFPWELAERVFQLPQGRGLNALGDAGDVETLKHPVTDEAILWDVDTPEDYERLRLQWGARQP